MFRAEKPKNAKPKAFPVDGAMLALPRMQFESAEDFQSRWLFDLLTSSCVFYHPDIDLLQTASPPGMPHQVMPNGANYRGSSWNCRKMPSVISRGSNTSRRHYLRSVVFCEGTGRGSSRLPCGDLQRRIRGDLIGLSEGTLRLWC